MSAWIAILVVLGIGYCIVRGAYNTGREHANPSPCQRCGHRQHEKVHLRLGESERRVMSDVPSTYCWGCPECEL